MERDVGLQRIGEPRLARLHLFKPAADRGKIRRIAEPRRQRRRLGLDRDPQLVEMAQKLDREFPLQRPAQDVGVEQVPRARGLDDGALPRSRADQPLGGQHLDGLASHRPADAVGLGDFRLGRERTMLVASGDDRPPERIEHAMGQVSPEYGGGGQWFRLCRVGSHQQGFWRNHAALSRGEATARLSIIVV